MADAPSGLALVHLALREYGLDCFRAFVESYRAHHAGTAHELVIAAKQFGTDEAFAEWRQVLDGIPHRLIHVPDGGFDLGTYFHVARTTAYDRYCFVNSLSEILVDGWLHKLAAAAELAPGGIVGASGSWRSVSTEVRHMYYPGLPRLLQPFRRLLGFFSVLRDYPAYPNPHLRTNTFFAARDILLSIKVPRIRTKPDSSLFESGWRNMTRQIRKRGGEVLVVDAVGCTYPASEWARSDTFWHGEQAGLLVADKQTRMYRDAEPSLQDELRWSTWRND